MAWDITVTLEDRPGTLAYLGEATGAAEINIDGVCGFLCEEGQRQSFTFSSRTRRRFAKHLRRQVLMSEESAKSW